MWFIIIEFKTEMLMKGLINMIKGKRIMSLFCGSVILCSSFSMRANGAEINRTYNNNYSFQTKTYTVYGTRSAYVCAPYVATLSSTSSDYDNAGKGVTYQIYTNVDGSGNPLEYKNNHCFDNACTALISTDALDSGTLANVGCRKYIARLYNNSSADSGIYESYYIKIHKRYK